MRPSWTPRWLTGFVLLAAARSGLGAPLPPLEATPTAGSGPLNVTLSFPSSAMARPQRMRIGVWEHRRPALLSDTTRDFVLSNGRWQTTVRLAADPGEYDLQVIGPGRTPVGLTQTAPVIFTGVSRSPGWWLVDGSPLTEAAPAVPATTVAAASPLFIPGLKRDLGKKPVAVNKSYAVAASAPLQWQTMPLPSLDTIMRPGYDMTALRPILMSQMRDARAAGSANLFGFSLLAEPGAGSAPPPPLGPLLTSLRGVLNTVAPEAALILEVEARSGEAAAARTLDAAAPYCDAVLIHLNPENNSDWPVKAARRVAEEQPGYDLPIWVRLEAPDESAAAAALFDGATGLVGPVTTGSDPQWAAIVERNSSLFIGSVTLEDLGLLPTLAPAASVAGQEAADEELVDLYRSFRSAARIPLMARLHPASGSAHEPLALVLPEHLEEPLLSSVHALVMGGSQLYAQGLPLLPGSGSPDARAVAMLGGAATGTAARATNLHLDDPWTFGVARHLLVPVEQTARVTPGKGSLAAQADTEKGKASLKAPYVPARLDDGSAGLLVTPTGKGRIMWMPHRVLPSESAPASVVETPPVGLPQDMLDIDRSTGRQWYYAAVAAFLEPGLVQLRGTDAAQAGAESTSVSVRASTKGTWMVALFNAADRAAALACTIGSVRAVAVDLATDLELPLARHGGQTEARVTIPAHGWKLIAFGTTRKALDEERFARRLNARFLQ